MARGAFVTELEKQKIRMLIKRYKGKRAVDLLPMVIESLNRTISLSTLQRLIAQVNKYNKQHRNDKRLKPWSLGSVTVYPVPAEVIPLLLKCQQHCKNTPDPESGNVEPLTIWESQWIARLNKLFKEPEANLKVLLDTAVWCSLYEQIWELSQTDAPVCDTTPFDDTDGERILKNIQEYICSRDDYSGDNVIDSTEVKQSSKEAKTR